MMRIVMANCKKFEILQAVVVAHAVFMVNMFKAFQCAAKVLRHNVAMLQDVFRGIHSPELDIPVGMTHAHNSFAEFNAAATLCMSKIQMTDADDCFSATLAFASPVGSPADPFRYFNCGQFAESFAGYIAEFISAWHIKSVTNYGDRNQLKEG